MAESRPLPCARHAACLEAREIDRVEVLRVPLHADRPKKVTSDDVEWHYSEKLTIRFVRQDRVRVPLLKAVRSVGTLRSSDRVDLRWGIIFFAADNKRVGAVFFDASGRVGVVGETPAIIHGQRFRWVRDCFGTSLE